MTMGVAMTPREGDLVKRSWVGVASAAGIPEGAMAFVSRHFDDAGRGGKGDPEQHKQGEE
jgi:hypothetical protein